MQGGAPGLPQVPGVSEKGIDGYPVSSTGPWCHCPEALTQELGAVKPKLARVRLQSDRGPGPNCVGMGHPLLMGTPFTSEPHCLGKDSSQGHPGHDDRITDGETEAQKGEVDPALQIGQIPRSVRADILSIPSFPLVRQTEAQRGRGTRSSPYRKPNSGHSLRGPKQGTGYL